MFGLIIIYMAIFQPYLPPYLSSQNDFVNEGKHKNVALHKMIIQLCNTTKEEGKDGGEGRGREKGEPGQIVTN